MQRLKNGLNIFNATPHPIRFLHPDGTVETVEPDAVVNAVPEEVVVTYRRGAALVRARYRPTPEGRAIIHQAKKDGADLIVGSVIAAQAYPGEVVAMTPAPGHERVPPEQKMMNPNKFVIY